MYKYVVKMCLVVLLKQCREFAIFDDINPQPVMFAAESQDFGQGGIGVCSTQCGGIKRV